MHTKILSENLTGIDDFGENNIKMYLKDSGVTMWNAVIWIQIGCSGWLLNTVMNFCVP
jgi:hypothetical protein